MYIALSFQRLHDYSACLAKLYTVYTQCNLIINKVMYACYYSLLGYDETEDISIVAKVLCSLVQSFSLDKSIGGGTGPD